MKQTGAEMSGRFWANVLLCVVIFGLAVVGVNKISASTGVMDLLLPPVQPEQFVLDNQDKIELGGVRIRVREAGNLVDVIFAVDNNSEQAVAGVEILCSFYDAEGNYQGRSRWQTHDTIEAGNRGLFSFTTEQYMSEAVVSSDCQLVAANQASKPLITVHRASVSHGPADADDDHAPAGH